MTAPLLALDEIACRRGERILFKGLDLALHPGEAGLVTGPNGAGKSSLLRIVAGLLPPAAGRVTRNAAMALAAEAPALDVRSPLARALLFWAEVDGRGRMQVEDALTTMGLERLADVPVRLLSTGQRRRATIARVIAGGAPIWLLDEPGSGLDVASLEALAAAMAQHRAGGGVVLAASHQPLGLTQACEIAL